MHSNLSFSVFLVQFCGEDPWSSWTYSEAARSRNWLQDHGQRAEFHERQKEGETLFFFIFRRTFC